MFKYLSILVGLLIFSINVYAEKALDIEKVLVPNSLSLLPPPPSTDSIAFMNDKAISEASFAKRNKGNNQRYIVAKKDAGYTATEISSNFSSSFGYEISKKTTPVIYDLIDLTIKTSSKSGSFAKNNYMRVRPFVFFDKSTCDPESEKELRNNGSYPSGHTTEGWAVALLLAEINPSNQEQILKKGYEYGQSRVVCGAHWSSDVQAGYVLGGAVFSALNSNNQFRSLISKAKKEIKIN